MRVSGSSQLLLSLPFRLPLPSRSARALTATTLLLWVQGALLNPTNTLREVSHRPRL